jgi:NTE family protein
MLKTEKLSYRQREVREDMKLVLDSEKKSYFHLIDGGVSDNLGLRAIKESVDRVGDIWEVMNYTGRENVHKIIFIVVNAESKTESIWDKLGTIPSLLTIVSNYSTIAISRYNRETMAILEES